MIEHSAEIHVPNKLNHEINLEVSHVQYIINQNELATGAFYEQSLAKPDLDEKKRYIKERNNRISSKLFHTIWPSFRSVEII